MTVPCRCLSRVKLKGGGTVKCGTRKSLKRRPQDYVRQPQCPSCGERKWMIDRWRLKHEMGKKPSCDCGGYHFIHRKKSKYCYHHPNVEQLQTERRN